MARVAGQGALGSLSSLCLQNGDSRCALALPSFTCACWWSKPRGPNGCTANTSLRQPPPPPVFLRRSQTEGIKKVAGVVDSTRRCAGQSRLQNARQGFRILFGTVSLPCGSRHNTAERQQSTHCPVSWSQLLDSA